MAKITSEELYQLLLELNVFGHHAQTLVRRIENYPNIREDIIIREFCMIDDEAAAQIVSRLTGTPLIKQSEIEKFNPEDFESIVPASAAVVPFKIDESSVHYMVEHPDSQESKDYQVKLFSRVSNRASKVYIASPQTRNHFFNQLNSHFHKTDRLFAIIKSAQKAVKNSEDDLKQEDILALMGEILKISIYYDASDIQFIATELFGVVQLKIGGTGKILAEFDRKLYDALMRLICYQIGIGGDSLKQRSVEGNFSSFTGLDPEIFKICSFRVQMTNPEAKSSNDKLACTIRLVRNNQPNISFQDAGFSINQIKKMEESIHLVSGLIVLIGPVNQGKSTTLYSMMNKIDPAQRLVKTIENPIEKRNPWWEQNELSDAGNLDSVEQEREAYRNQIKGMVRKSPDCLLAGELRSKEEAEEIFGLAYASTLCFSTIHSENIAAAIGRLSYWGLSKYDLASVIRLMVAQRLLRKLCPKCKTIETDPSNLEEIKIYKNHVEPEEQGKFSWQAVFKYLEKPENVYTESASGCEYCDHTGFKGRVLIAEMLSYNDHGFKEMLLSDNHNAIQDYMIKNGISLWHSGMSVALRGQVSINEVIRNTQRLST